MNTDSVQTCVAFEGLNCLAAGEALPVALKVHEIMSRGEREPVLVFDDATGQQVELDLRGSVDDVRARYASTALPSDDPPTDSPTRGRPKLGVVPREVTLLPRHWEWLNGQAGGASAALRKLVDQARNANQQKDRIRMAQESACRFMSSLAGNLPGFEEATRALYRRDQSQFNALVSLWPADVSYHGQRLSSAVFSDDDRQASSTTA